MRRLCGPVGSSLIRKVTPAGRWFKVIRFLVLAFTFPNNGNVSDGEIRVPSKFSSVYQRLYSLVDSLMSVDCNLVAHLSGRF